MPSDDKYTTYTAFAENSDIDHLSLYIYKKIKTHNCSNKLYKSPVLFQPRAYTT